jgi:TIR domain
MRLFGDDIFISYAHADGGEYALALVARLSKRYAVYVDRVGNKAGEQISDKVLRHLKNASMLIVIVSEDTTREDSKVREEVELFAKTERPILVIDAGGALERSAWGKNLKGLSIAKETPEALAKHRPSPGVRRSVEQTRKYWTRTNRLLAIAASIIIVTIGVVAVAWRQVDHATREVQRQQTAARVTWLSSDASLLATGGLEGHVELRDLVGGKVLASFEAGSWVDQLRVSADHQRIAVSVGAAGDVGYRVLLYDVATKQITCDIPTPDGPLIAFKPGTRELLVVGTAGNVMTLDDEPLHVADVICREVGHSLSPKRWAQLTGTEPWVDTCAEVAKSPRSSSGAR